MLDDGRPHTRRRLAGSSRRDGCNSRGSCHPQSHEHRSGYGPCHDKMAAIQFHCQFSGDIPTHFNAWAASAAMANEWVSAATDIVDPGLDRALCGS